jgi:hypothetical protein
MRSISSNGDKISQFPGLTVRSARVILRALIKRRSIVSPRHANWQISWRWRSRAFSRDKSGICSPHGDFARLQYSLRSRPPSLRPPRSSGSPDQPSTPGHHDRRLSNLGKKPLKTLALCREDSFVTHGFKLLVSHVVAVLDRSRPHQSPFDGHGVAAWAATFEMPSVRFFGDRIISATEDHLDRNLIVTS